MSKTKYISVSIDKTYIEAETLEELARANAKRYGDTITVNSQDGRVYWYWNKVSQPTSWPAVVSLEEAERKAYYLLLSRYIEALGLQVYKVTPVVPKI